MTLKISHLFIMTSLLCTVSLSFTKVWDAERHAQEAQNVKDDFKDAKYKTGKRTKYISDKKSNKKLGTEGSGMHPVQPSGTKQISKYPISKR